MYSTQNIFFSNDVKWMKLLCIFYATYTWCVYLGMYIQYVYSLVEQCTNSLDNHDQKFNAMEKLSNVYINAKLKKKTWPEQNLMVFSKYTSI